MIAIAGGKGGCGKTTTALGVGRALAHMDVRVRIADLDTGMPNVHRLAGVEREPTLADVVGEPGRYQRDAHGVEILPAPRVTASVDVEDALDVLGLGDAITLLDCPAGAGPDAAAPLQAASAVVLVSTDRPESLEDAAKTRRMARSLDVPVLGAVLTRTDTCSRRARATLPTDHVVAVPAAADPLQARPVQDCYDVVAQWLVGDEPARVAGGAAETASHSGRSSGDTARAGGNPARTGGATGGAGHNPTTDSNPGRAGGTWARAGGNQKRAGGATDRSSGNPDRAPGSNRGRNASR